MSAKKNPPAPVAAPRGQVPLAPGRERKARPETAPAERSLDPADWDQTRVLAHQVLDEALDFLRSLRDQPVWRPVPQSVRQQLKEPLPMGSQDLEETYRQFREQILPYSAGNIHPRFFGWVQGTGTVAGVVAEMLAATMNSSTRASYSSPRTRGRCRPM